MCRPIFMDAPSSVPSEPGTATAAAPVARVVLLLPPAVAGAFRTAVHTGRRRGGPRRSVSDHDGRGLHGGAPAPRADARLRRRPRAHAAGRGAGPRAWRGAGGGDRTG